MMSAKNLLIPLTASLSLTLSGCSIFGYDIKPIEVQNVKEERIYLDIKDLDPITPRDVQWIVITPENADEVFADLKDKEYDLVLFGLTDDSYESLSLNMSELREYIIQQRLIIKKYKEYYEPDNGKN